MHARAGRAGWSEQNCKGMDHQNAITLYDVLEISQEASALVIKAAYRVLAQHNHPDKHGGSLQASERLSLINRAYFTLSDPHRRWLYDQSICQHKHFTERRGSGKTSNQPRSQSTTEAVSRPFVFRPLKDLPDA